MTLRTLTSGTWSLLWAAAFGLLTACMDHAMVTEPTPEDDTSNDIVLNAGLTTYRVTGADPQAIAQSANGAGGGEDGRQRFIGFHRWNIEWRVDAARDPAGCAITRAWVVVESRITLPEWDEPPNPDPGVRAQWSEFVVALQEHELGHQQLVVDGARRIRAILLRVRADGCATIVERANTAGQAALAMLRDEDLRYDLETRHGATQGAVWPPFGTTTVVLDSR